MLKIHEIELSRAVSKKNIEKQLEVWGNLSFIFSSPRPFFTILATGEASLLLDHAGAKDKRFYASGNIEK